MYCVLRSEIGGKPGNRVIFSGEDRRDAVRFLDRTVKEAPGFIYKIVEIPNKAETMDSGVQANERIYRQRWLR